MAAILCPNCGNKEDRTITICAQCLGVHVGEEFEYLAPDSTCYSHTSCLKCGYESDLVEFCDAAQDDKHGLSPKTYPNANYKVNKEQISSSADTDNQS
jgi:hypothetical protein